MKSTVIIDSSQAYVANFLAKQITVLNVSGKEVYIRLGGLDSPQRGTAHLIVPALTFFSTAIPETTQFGFTLSGAVAPSDIGANPIVTFSDFAEPVAFSSVNLPQTGFQPLYLNLQNNSIAAGGNVTIYTMPSGKTKALVFGVWGSIDHPTGTVIDCRIQYFNGSLNLDIVRFKAGVAAAPIWETMPPHIFSPSGLLLFNAQSFRVVNAAPTTGNFTVNLWVAPFG